MSVERLTSELELSQKHTHIFIYGETNDFFLPPSLKMLSIDELLWLYLHDKGYERIVFIDPIDGIYTWDQRSFELLNIGSHQSQEKQEDIQQKLADSGWVEDDHWEDALEDQPHGGSDSPASPPEIENRRRNDGKYVANVHEGLDILELINLLADLDDRKTAFVFTQFNQIFIRISDIQNSLRERLMQLLANKTTWKKKDVKFFYIFVGAECDGDVFEYVNRNNLKLFKSFFDAKSKNIEKYYKCKIM